MKNKVYYKSFFISGFTYYEGPFNIKKLKIGTKLKLKAEPDNRYDENAVAIYYKKKKIGFIPKDANYSIAKFLNQEHKIFKAVIQQIDKNEHPERQFRVALYIKENKTSTIKTSEELLKKIKNISWLWENEDDEQLLKLKNDLQKIFE